MNRFQKYTDDDLLAQFRADGDKVWVGELYKRYAHLVMGLCFKYLKDEESARDAVVDIFELIMEKLLLNDVIFFRSWLYTVSRHHLLRQIRKKQSSREHTLPVDDVFGENIMENSDGMSLNSELEWLDVREQLLHDAINDLKEEQKGCIRDFYFEKRSYTDIALATGLDVKQVKSHIQNGKRNLKLYLQEHKVFV